MADGGDDTVSVIDTTTDVVVATIAVGDLPGGVSVNPAGTRVYVANIFSDDVSVVDTATNTVVATVPAGDGPTAFGQFIRPALPPSVPTLPRSGAALLALLLLAGLTVVCLRHGSRLRAPAASRRQRVHEIGAGADFSHDYVQYTPHLALTQGAPPGHRIRSVRLGRT